MDTYKDTLKPFNGTIDEALEHCLNINVDELDNACELRETIKFLQRETGCSAEEAEKMYTNLIEQELRETCNKMVNDGLLEIVHDENDGEPRYMITELGKQSI